MINHKIDELISNRVLSSENLKTHTTRKISLPRHPTQPGGVKLIFSSFKFKIFNTFTQIRIFRFHGHIQRSNPWIIQNMELSANHIRIHVSKHTVDLMIILTLNALPMLSLPPCSIEGVQFSFSHFCENFWYLFAREFTFYRFYVCMSVWCVVGARMSEWWGVWVLWVCESSRKIMYKHTYTLTQCSGRIQREKKQEFFRIRIFN